MSAIKFKGRKSRGRASTTRRVLWLFAVLFVLLFTAYFVITSSAFVKRYILPRVGDSIHAELTADSVSLSPFSKLELTNLGLKPYGEEPLLSGGRVRLRYSLIAFLKGRIEVDEVLVDSATVNLVQKPDGSSNLKPLLAGGSKSAGPKSASTISAVDIKSIVFTNVTLRQVTQRTGASPGIVEIGPLNFTAGDIRNGSSTAKLDINALIRMEKAVPTNATPAKLAARLQGGFSFSLNDGLRPTTLQGRAVFTVDQAQGGFADLSGVTATFTADAAPTQIKQLELSFAKGGARLGGVQLTGPFDSAKREGKLNLEVSSIDRHVLNLLGAASGMDFGTTSISTTNEIELAKGGSVISIFGDLRVRQLQVIRAGQSTPKLDLLGDYSVAVDQTKMSAVIGAFKLTGTQAGRPMLNAGLSGPMTITWGKSGDTAGTSTLSFTLGDLALENWQPLLGDIAPAGKARMEGKLLTKADGKVLNYEYRLHADDLTVLMGEQKIVGLTITFDATGEARDLKEFKITESGAQVFHAGQPAFSFQGTASYNSTNAATAGEFSILSALPQLGGMFSTKPAEVSSGVLEITGKAIQNPGTNLFTGKLRLVDLTARLGTTAFERFGTDLDVELVVAPQRLTLRKAAGVFSDASKPSGRFNLTGNCALNSGAADFTLRLENLNQNALRPFLEPRFPGKKLTTATLYSTATLSMTAEGSRTIKGDFALTNLTATEVRTGKVSPPVAARLQLDATLTPKLAQLRQCLLTLTPKDKAKNQIALTGNLDFAKTNGIAGAIKLAAESLDLTRYYDLCSAAESARVTPAGQGSAGTTLPDIEPAPLPSQFNNLTAELNVDRLVIREVNIEKLSGRARLDGSRAVIKPCFLSLNGASVKASVDLDLGVPGYRYDINFDAQDVPLAPVVNTFQPQNRGQMAGHFTGLLAIKGEGVTGPNLQKNLTGEVSVVMTNVNLSLANARMPVVRTLLDTVIGIPELIRNPLTSVENLVGRLVNFGGQHGGWSDQFMSAPIQVIETRIKAGEGRIQLEQAEVRSAAFRARATGDIQLAAIVTNSTIKIPVALSLNRPLASQIGLVTADAPTNALYYAMPQFLEIEGTLGKPVTKTDKLVLAELAARSGASAAKGIGSVAGETVGGILQKGGNIIGGLIGGKSSTNSPANSSTNKPSGPFDLFR